MARIRQRIAGRVWITAITSHPVAVLAAVRWLGWLIALIGVLSGAGTEQHGADQRTLLLVTALASAGETVLAWQPRFQPPIARRDRRILVLVAAAANVISLGAVYFSGGWGSPFYHYAVTALLLPAFLLRLGPALAWLAAFTLAYLAAVVQGGAYDGSLPDLLGRRIGTVATPLLVVLVEWYLAHLIYQLTRERVRAEQALAETVTLFRVSEAVVTNPADVAAMLAGVSGAARASRLFSHFRVTLTGPDGQAVAEDAFGDRAAAPTRTLPLAVRNEALGTLAVTPAAAGLGAGGDAFLEALARQVALGAYDARLFAQREELATQAERARIAREIHDGMAQSLYMLSLGLEACADASEAKQGELGRRLGALVGISRQALWEARRYIFDLTPPAAGEHSLVAMLENLTREFEMVSRVPARIVAEGGPAVPASLAAALYRIGQEALANVFKHAQARHVTISLLFLSDTLRLTVEDDGLGIAPDARTGYGLVNMRRRAEEAGGSCAIESKPGAGTCVRVEIPLPDGLHQTAERGRG